jgi:hypothetical protein
MLLDLYKQEAPKATMSTSTSSKTVNVPITAFADDTNLLGNNNHHNKSISTLVFKAKCAFKTLEQFTPCNRTFMELGKCTCYLSIWNFQDDGYAYTIPPEELQITIEVKDIAGNQQTIQQLHPDKRSYWG